MQGLVFMGIAALCGLLALRADEKPERWFFVAACLLNLLGVLVAAHEGNFWKWAPNDSQDDTNYHRD